MVWNWSLQISLETVWFEQRILRFHYKMYGLNREFADVIRKCMVWTGSFQISLENVWFDAYDLLSNAGFDILIDENRDNSMTVFHRDYLMVFGKNGMTLKKDTSK